MDRLKKIKLVIIPLEKDIPAIQSGWMDEYFFDVDNFFKRGYSYDYTKIQDDCGFDLMIPGDLIRRSIVRVEYKFDD